jgi:hypothetical protein
MVDVLARGLPQIVRSALSTALIQASTDELMSPLERIPRASCLQQGFDAFLYMKLPCSRRERECTLTLLHCCNETRSPLQIWPNLLCRGAERLVQ